ncbi:hypothetical protein, partial [Mesorhizobium sp. M7A.F.Ca.CA.001.11.2.1]|uniref:hypothetical protein n=1 Tax=Mesorhizobium sp. M7A.F.Ca.CA.001.11.2.1 TaxID=2496693 RepID=UPI0019D25DE2
AADLMTAYTPFGIPRADARNFITEVQQSGLTKGKSGRSSVFLFAGRGAKTAAQFWATCIRSQKTADYSSRPPSKTTR